MPKTPFMNAVLDLTESRHQNNAALAGKLSETFQVSPSSAAIRLVQLGLTESVIKDDKIYEEKQFQLYSQIPGTL